MKLLKKQIEPQWFDFDEGVAVQVRPFPRSRTAFTGLLFDVVETEKRRFTHCLVDWKGIKDEDGEEIECNDESKTKIYDYGLFPLKLSAFIYEKIGEVSKSIEEDEKN